MGLLSGALTVRRFSVIGEVPDGFRDLYRSRLDEYAFHEPPQGLARGEVEGWVHVQNLLDTEFSDSSRWLSEPYLMFALRIDKKTLPSKLLKATLEKRYLSWCTDNGTERCPASVRKQLREELEDEWLRRVLPSVRLVEMCWNYSEGWLVATSLSDTMLDRLRKRFYQTFGMRLTPWSPLDHLSDTGMVDKLLATSPARFTEVAP